MAVAHPQPRSAFDAALANDERVRTAVLAHFGVDGETVLAGMRNEHVDQQHQADLNDLLLDLFAQEGEPASSFEGRGDFGPFPITVLRFGPVFWITAEEFDDIGFFGELTAAVEAAAANYEPFIAAAVENVSAED